MSKAQHAILRFAKYKGPTVSRIEAHNERTKESYDSNPDIKTELSKHNFHPVIPQGKYREVANQIIRSSGCRVRKDSVTAVEALITQALNSLRVRAERRSVNSSPMRWNS